MIMKKEIKHSKNILFDESRLRELDSIFKKHSDSITYDAQTKDNSELKFESVDELLMYDNCKKGRIISLDIRCYNHYSQSIIASFQNEVGIEIAKVKYEFSDSDEMKIFDAEINNFLEKITGQYIIPKLLKTVSLFLFPLSALYYSFYCFQNGTISNLGINIIINIIDSFFLLICFNKFVVDHLFPKVEFLIGEEIKRYESIKALRNNIFWVIIVGIIIALTGNYLWNYLPFVKP